MPRKDPAKRFQSVDELTTALRRETARRPTVSQWAVFVADFRGAGQDLLNAVQPQVEKAREFLRNRNWREMPKWPAKRTIGAALGATALLTSLVVISLIASRKSHVPGSGVIASATAAVIRRPPPRRQLDRSSDFQPARAAGMNSGPMITSSAVNLGLTPAPATEKSVSDARAKTDTAARKSTMPALDSKAVVAKQRVKPQAIAHAAVLPLPASGSQPALVTAVATVAPVDTAKPTADDAGRESAGFPAAATMLDTSTDAKASDVDSASSAAKGLYLEVGSFKDPTWADNAVEKLRQLGLHSISYHKNVLWMQSYQVRVGPYANPQDLDEARQKLIAEGFKPHPVK